MHIPYTYLIGWSSHNIYYYGVRYSSKCNPKELWKTYFTSSKHVTQFRVKNGEPDIIQIRKTFSNKKDAIIWENKVLQRMKAHINIKFLNKTNNKSIINDSFHYEKLGKFLKGKKRSNEVKKAISKKYTVERKEKSKILLQTYGNMGMYEIIFPDGVVETITHLKSFCEMHNLSHSSMSSLSTGKWPAKNKKYKGFSIRKLKTVSMVRNH